MKPGHLFFSVVIYSIPFGLLLTHAEVEGLDGELRLNQVQYIGTHNSYHIAMGDALAILLKAADYKASEEWNADKLIYSTDFTHPSITTQLQMGLRQFELDVYADPSGGRFMNPSVLGFLKATPWELPMGFGNMGDLAKPGFKVLHNPEYDFRSTNYLLRGCLQEMYEWSLLNKDHLPIIIHIEAKEGQAPAVDKTAEPATILPFDNQAWLELEQEILSVIPRDRILTPDCVRGNYKDLRQAIWAKGWPSLDQLSGKFIFFLLNKKDQTDNYMEFAKSLEGRLFFASLTPSDRQASWFRVPEPTYGKLQEMIESGFLVTTMADKHTENSRENSVDLRDQAFASGAQFILTDNPVPDRRFSNYHVSFGEFRWVRANPVTLKKD